MSAYKNEAVADPQAGLREKKLHRLFGDLWGGAVAALIAIPQAMALGLLAFAALGPSWAAVGVVAAILASVVGGVVAGVIPAGNCHMMGARTSVTVVFAGILSTLVAHPLLQTPQGPDVPQVLTLAFIALFLSGLIQAGFGLLGVGRTIKFVPYPVIAGFMNGIAILMFISQLPPTLGLEGGHTLQDLWHGTAAVKPASLLVCIVVVAAIFAAPRIARRIPTLVFGLIIGIVMHYSIAWFAPGAVGGEVGELPVIDFAPHELIAMARLTLRDDIYIWFALLLPSALLLAAVASLDGLLAAIVTDPVTHGRHNSSRLLTSQGAANAVAAAFGALPAISSTHTRVASYLAGGRTPRCAIFHGLFMLATLVILAPYIARVPTAALAGVIIYTAWTLVDRWTRDLIRRLKVVDIDRGEILLNLAVVIAVALSLVLLNIMAAFAIGIVSTVMLLLFKLSGSPVRRALDGTVRSSLKIRAPEARAVLRPLARQIRILELEGIIFFGTADRLQSEVENLPHEARYLILDFRHVTEMDASGARALETIGQTAARRNLRVLLSHVRPGEGHGRYLQALGVDAVMTKEHWFSDLDRALEWTEDRLLERARFEDAPELQPREMAVFDGFDAAEMAIIETLLQRQELVNGDVIFREGDAGDRMYLIARGAVSIKVQIAGESRARRLATFVPGVFFGEMAMLEGERRSADAFAKGERVTLYSIDAEALLHIGHDHPQLGAKLYRNLGRELAARLRITSGALRALE